MGVYGIRNGMDSQKGKGNHVPAASSSLPDVLSLLSIWWRDTEWDESLWKGIKGVTRFSELNGSQNQESARIKGALYNKRPEEERKTRWDSSISSSLEIIISMLLGEKKDLSGSDSGNSNCRVSGWDAWIQWHAVIIVYPWDRILLMNTFIDFMMILLSSTSWLTDWMDGSSLEIIIQRNQNWWTKIGWCPVMLWFTDHNSACCCSLWIPLRFALISPDTQIIFHIIFIIKEFFIQLCNRISLVKGLIAICVSMINGRWLTWSLRCSENCISPMSSCPCPKFVVSSYVMYDWNVME